MKNSIFIWVMLLLFQVSVSAQSWCPQGAEWTYNYYTMYGWGYEKVFYEKDTIIAFQSCKKLNAERAYVASMNPGSTYSYAPPPMFTFEQNDTVYFFLEEAFRPTYFFNAQQGDTLEIFGGLSACDDSIIKQVVDSTGIIQINSESLRFYTVRILNLSNQSISPYPDSLFIIEKIGVTNNYLIPYFLCITDGDGHSLRCYKDDNFSLYQTEPITDCEYIYTNVQDISGSATNRVEIFPNPANNKLFVVAVQKMKTINIYDVLGRKVNIHSDYKSEVCASTDISHLPNGMYFVEVQFSDKQKVSAKILKH